MKKRRNHYLVPDLTDMPKYSLCDAVRYFRAFEVGGRDKALKYEMAIRLRTLRDGQVVRNRIRLPHPVTTNQKIVVICPDEMAEMAREAGAYMAGKNTIIEDIKEDRLKEFDRCVCHVSCIADLQKSGVARILGPRRLMPSTKDRTVTADVVSTLRELTSATEYRERVGVIRVIIGQLEFTAEQLRENIAAVMGSIKKDIVQLSDRISKDIHEVVLSSTTGPGLTLSGEFKVDGGTEPEMVSGAWK